MENSMDIYDKSESSFNEYMNKLNEFEDRYTNSKRKKSRVHNNFNFQADFVMFINKIMRLEDNFLRNALIYEVIRRKNHYKHLKDIGNFLFVCLINSIVIIATVTLSGTSYAGIGALIIGIVLIYSGYHFIKKMEYSKAAFYDYSVDCIDRYNKKSIEIIQ